MALTDKTVRNAKPSTKPQKLFDGGGLFLLVTPAGGKLWRLKYRYDGKEKLLALGAYEEVSLLQARERRDDARKLLAAEVDPSLAKKARTTSRKDRAANSFEVVAREWHAKFSKGLSESHATRNLRRLEIHVFPHMGALPTMDVEPPHLLDVLQRIEQKKTLETAHRVRSLVGQVMRYAVSTGRAKRDPSADLRGAIPPARIRHHAAITDPKQLGGFLREIYGYTGTAPVTAALKLSPLVFQRPGELRLAEWTEFDLKTGLWTVPSDRMKRRKEGKEFGPDHLVPLSKQAVSILEELRLITGQGRYVFPSARGAKRPMSDMALSAAFRRMGIDPTVAVPHGWRATAFTLAVEKLGIPSKIVDMQLAHEVKDANGTAYNRTKWLDQRHAMMQAWADYLDALRANAGLPGTEAIPASGAYENV
jgi:integrase